MSDLTVLYPMMKDLETFIPFGCRLTNLSAMNKGKPPSQTNPDVCWQKLA